MKLLTIVLSIFFLTTNLSAQIFEDIEVDETKISDWITTDINEYEGVYFFGISEAESQVFVCIDKSFVCVQIQDFIWVELDNKHLDWRPKYQNFTNCRIIGNEFYSDETNGEFVLYKNGNKVVKGLKLDNPPNDYDKKYEIGQLGEEDVSKYLSGTYTNTKFEVILPSILNSYNSQELIILRNEIFARYGYIFKNGGSMDIFFRGKDWYSGLYSNVDKWLTIIEKENIKNIKQIEEKKGNP
ncbi:MAG TPA: YARHG domain-containing protein [Cytophagales bacterium]|nr:YARHG domain-containing protein [Cytophagales bacterium]